MEAAGKVKALEAENKKLIEENKVLTENFNSERVSVCKVSTVVTPKSVGGRCVQN